MRCTHCKSKSFLETQLLTREGDRLLDVEVHVCQKCGHIELFASEDARKRLKSKKTLDNTGSGIMG